MNLTLVLLLLGATLAVPSIAGAVTEGDFEVNPRGPECQAPRLSL
jgi:hypothetical protein